MYNNNFCSYRIYVNFSYFYFIYLIYLFIDIGYIININGLRNNTFTA